MSLGDGFLAMFVPKSMFLDLELGLGSGPGLPWQALGGPCGAWNPLEALTGSGHALPWPCPALWALAEHGQPLAWHGQLWSPMANL